MGRFKHGWLSSGEYQAVIFSSWTGAGGRLTRTFRELAEGAQVGLSYTAQVARQ